jgi:hypothetical protein
MAVDYAGPRRARTLRTATGGRRAFVRSFDCSPSSRGAHRLQPAPRRGITRDDVGSPDYYIVRQAIYAAVGGIAMLGVSLLGPTSSGYWRQLYAVSCSCLLVIPLRTKARARSGGSASAL